VFILIRANRLFFLILVALLVFFAIATMGVVGFYQTQVQQPLGIPRNTLFEIKTGASSHHVMMEVLKKSKSSIHPIVGKIWLKLTFTEQTIKTGWYELNPNMSVQDAFDVFVTGKQKQFNIALVEGLTFQQWHEALTNNVHLYNDLSKKKENELNEMASNRFDAPVSSLEGVFLADTYFFEHGQAISQILERALDAMVQALSDLEQSVSLPYVLRNRYEAISLASIVEKETALSSERPRIAGVFINRLEKNMRLQTDPTVIYGLGSDFDGNLTRAHLRSATPYNTYVIKGLPPSPIAMVGREALRAVYHYEQNDFFYFVAKGQGAHAFSKTLNEHNQAVKQYQLKNRQ
jgi:UPF0755 protein